ncbi:MAG: archease [Kiritimatiellia bacterium]
MRQKDTEGSSRTWPAWIVPLEHTADTGIIVKAPTLKELFQRAAWGLFATICAVDGVRPKRVFPISVTAPDREALLVRWLSELNFLHQTRRVLLCRFDVIRFKAESLDARVWGENISRVRHRVTTEIKAVTYYNLRIERQGRLWSASVLFDI